MRTKAHAIISANFVVEWERRRQGRSGDTGRADWLRDAIQIKRPEREADHSPSSSAKVQKVRRNTCCVLGRTAKPCSSFLQSFVARKGAPVIGSTCCGWMRIGLAHKSALRPVADRTAACVQPVVSQQWTGQDKTEAVPV